MKVSQCADALDEVFFQDSNIRTDFGVLICDFLFDNIYLDILSCKFTTDIVLQLSDISNNLIFLGFDKIRVQCNFASDLIFDVPEILFHKYEEHK